MITNEFIEEMQKGKNCIGQFNPNGTINAYIIGNTTIPFGNPNFDVITRYLYEQNIELICPLEWVEEIKDKDANLLYYKTNIGCFTDSQENEVSLRIKKMIEQNKIELRELSEYFNTDSLEINIFLPRSFQLHGEGYPNQIQKYCFEDNYLKLPFPIKVEILQQIEKSFFEHDKYIYDNLRNTNGNVLRFIIDKSNIVKVFKWSKKYLTDQLEYLEQSLEYDYALQKRNRNKGPRIQWCFDYSNLQSYIWISILYISNKLIYLINNQAREKTMGLLSRHELGNLTSMKVRYDNGEYSFINLPNLQDQQITIFPSQLNWEYKSLELPFQRIRFLFNQGLYFEAIIITQAVCESLVNGMYPRGNNKLKWEDSYKHLSLFFNQKLRNDSLLKELLNEGLYKIYKYRNDFAHDYMEHTPDYIFEFEHFNKIKQLLKSFIDVHTNMHFLQDVDLMYKERNEFIQYYLGNDK